MIISNKSLAVSTALAAILAVTTPVFAADAIVDADPIPQADPISQSEFTISVFGGANFSPHSPINYVFSNGQTGKVTPGWDGASFEMPPYYGVRGTYWLESAPELGLALTFTHAKVKADPVPAPFTHLEFTDGINFLTLSGIYRHEMDNGFTPYIGAGGGLSIPHVEVSAPGIASTREYQVTGLAGEFFAGVDYAFTENLSVYGEYKFSYGDVQADLTGGGSLDTHVISNQVIFGVTYKLF